MNKEQILKILLWFFILGIFGAIIYRLYLLYKLHQARKRNRVITTHTTSRPPISTGVRRRRR